MLNVYTEMSIQKHSQGVLEMLTIIRKIIVLIEFHTTNFLLYIVLVEQ